MTRGERPGWLRSRVPVVRGWTVVAESVLCWDAAACAGMASPSAMTMADKARIDLAARIAHSSEETGKSLTERLSLTVEIHRIRGQSAVRGRGAFGQRWWPDQVKPLDERAWASTAGGSSRRG